MRHNHPGEKPAAQRASRKGAQDASMPEKAASWPGVPGKTQPRDRSNATKRVPAHVKPEGL